jgi:ABC-type molybdenum transport system ATPase subunit/photorepair protein PhrA
MPKEFPMTNVKYRPEIRRSIGYSSFELRHSFVIMVSSLVIPWGD